MPIQLNNPAKIFLFSAALSLTVFAYFPGLSGDYIFDDFPNIVHNKDIQIDALNPDALKGAAFSSGAGILRRPISMASFALNYYFFGIKPFSFKVVNLIIHLLNGAALFLLGMLVLRAYQRIYSPNWATHSAFWISLSASASWLLHPINLTGVLYIVQRMTSLATLFMIIGLCFYTYGRLRLWNNEKGLNLLLVGLLIFTPLALFSKETGILLPVFMLVIETALFRFRDKNRTHDKKVIGFFLLGLALPAVAGLVWMAANTEFFFGRYLVRTFTLYERMLTEFRVLLFYIQMILTPSVGKLGLYHDDIAVSRGLFDPVSTFPSIVMVIGLLFSSAYIVKKAPLLGLGILWFFAGHLLESTVLPLEIAFEHRNYLASYGILLSVFYLLLFPTRNRSISAIRNGGAAALIALFLFTTHSRSLQWQDNVTQAVFEVTHHPESARANASAGRIFANLSLKGHLPDLEKAWKYFEKSRSLDTAGILAPVSMVILASKKNQDINPEWMREIKFKLRNKPISSSDMTSLKNLLRCQSADCDIDNKEMMSVFISLFNNPRLRLIPSTHSYALTLYGEFLINSLQNYEAGRLMFETSVKISPDTLRYRINLVNLLLLTGQFEPARSEFAEITERNIFGQYPREIENIRKDLSGIHGAQPDTPDPVPFNAGP